MSWISLLQCLHRVYEHAVTIARQALLMGFVQKDVNIAMPKACSSE